ncbi:hypothetical protein B9Z55_000587 [Caenorhabditis nigoni]|uniref:V-type proton ATPase subunit G n=1 Tax=Caenorhabditis nigoni TaxID=1611254 RepID=A0A2G5VTU1_9PELO|nr:hypothetical protein B9Z55_000587 [Caenorhabditis nigoni]
MFLVTKHQISFLPLRSSPTRKSRKRKLQRTKQAEQEAQAEVEKYKQKANKISKDSNNNISETRKTLRARVVVTLRIKGMKQSVASNKQAVIAHLLQLVCGIKQELHYN